MLCREPGDNEWNINKMQEAAHLMEGTHNFLNFSKRSERNPLRTVDNVLITPKDELCLVDVEGASFLWNMVRKIMTVLLSVGKGELELEDVQRFLDPQYQAAITPMPPESLILMDVFYQGVKFKEDEYARVRFIKALEEECFDHQKMVAATKEMMSVLREN